MKKFTIFGAIFLISTILLFGCSNGNEETTQTNQTEEEQSGNQPAEQEEAKKDEDTDELAVLLEAATKANKEIKSYSLKSETDIVQKFADEKNHMLSTHEQDTVLDPYQTKKFSSTEKQDDADNKDSWNDEKITVYNVDGYTYVNVQAAYGDGKQWIKSKNKYTNEELSAQDSIHVQGIFDNLAEIITDKTLSEEAGSYIVTLDVDLDKVTELEKENPGLAQSEDEKANQKMIDTYKVEQMDYQLTFDKDTKYLTELNVLRKYSFELDFEGKTDTMIVTEKSNTLYKNQNNVDEIVVPNEVMENAKEN